MIYFSGVSALVIRSSTLADAQSWRWGFPPAPDRVVQLSSRMRAVFAIVLSCKGDTVQYTTLVPLVTCVARHMHCCPNDASTVPACLACLLYLSNQLRVRV